MEAKLAEIVRRAASLARRRAMTYPGSIRRDDLPWAVLEAFDADVRGHVERDRRIEDERDRVLIAAVTLAETPLEEGPDELGAARDHLIEAIDYLEQAVLRFGLVNRKAAALGYGLAGQSLTTRS
ncbi:hypothetical protein [Methylobacterium planeticum]|uniref:Uncharacterized protein n=1 Tax=Methylobacterium planeticum TaxID=2615211 RepID=A0A6N6MXC9_9HYPH|nr:hypothetical protein [Methylobacterium planeticum]KAB1075476.1 hypothetical protein F6X51_01965 [Methylobacterium planeticum]